MRISQFANALSKAFGRRAKPWSTLQNSTPYIKYYIIIFVYYYIIILCQISDSNNSQFLNSCPRPEFQCTAGHNLVRIWLWVFIWVSIRGIGSLKIKKSLCYQRPSSRGMKSRRKHQRCYWPYCDQISSTEQWEWRRAVQVLIQN